MYQGKFACKQARLHLEESRGSSTGKETRVPVLLRLALLAVKTVNGELARRLKTSLTVYQQSYKWLHVRLYFDCTSAMVLELNVTLEPNSV